MNAAPATINARSATVPEPAGIDRAAVLRHLKLNANDVATQALLLIAQTYNLDPLLKEVVLIDGRPYITRDGYITIAHRSGVLDGVVVRDQHETDTHYLATVAVYRKDMTHPFEFVGRYPKANTRQSREYGPEMALKRAEVNAYRRAFNVTGAGAAEESFDHDTITQAGGQHYREPAAAMPATLPACDDDADSPAWPDATDQTAGEQEPSGPDEPSDNPADGYAHPEQVDQIRQLTAQLRDTNPDLYHRLVEGDYVCGVLIRERNAAGRYTIVADYTEASAVIDTLIQHLRRPGDHVPEPRLDEEPF